jgi:hypothetical protein
MLSNRFLDALLAAYRRLELALVTFVVTLLVTANSLFSRVRMSHENGIACSGRLRIVDNPGFPARDLFRPGRSFGCRVRHGAASFRDDPKLVVRSASVKLADTRFESPLDILMNTGTVPLFWSARAFAGFTARSIAGKGKFYVGYLRRHPQAALGGGDSVHHAPESFGSMVYHTKTVSGS